MDAVLMLVAQYLIITILVISAAFNIIDNKNIFE